MRDASRRAYAEPGPLGLGMLAGGRTTNNGPQAAQTPADSADVFCGDCGVLRIEYGGPRCHHCERELGGECGW